MWLVNLGMHKIKRRTPDSPRLRSCLSCILITHWGMWYWTSLRFRFLICEEEPWVFLRRLTEVSKGVRLLAHCLAYSKYLITINCCWHKGKTGGFMKDHAAVWAFISFQGCLFTEFLPKSVWKMGKALGSDSEVGCWHSHIFCSHVVYRPQCAYMTNGNVDLIPSWPGHPRDLFEEMLWAAPVWSKESASCWCREKRGAAGGTAYQNWMKILGLQESAKHGIYFKI
jgi:hypothetical protein